MAGNCIKHSAFDGSIDGCPVCAEINKLEAENKRLRDRDLNATIELCYDNGDNPFAREELKVLDVGVADNCYVVESEVLKKALAENKRLLDVLDRAYNADLYGCAAIVQEEMAEKEYKKERFTKQQKGQK